MKENKHTKQELAQWQALPLSVKVRMTQQRIRDWVREFGEEGVYISFSGGKDSTVLVDLVDKTFPNNNIPLVFIDTGLEYPQIRDFVKQYGDRVTWLKPKMNFKQVIETYGYPFVSKKVCDSLSLAKRNIEKLGYTNKEDLLKADIGEYDERIAMLCGRYNEWFKNRNGRSASKNGQEMRSQKKYLFMAFGDYEFSSKCCDVMKKNPFHKYSKETCRKPMTGEQAYESELRTSQWLRNGCNGFDLKEPKSTPLAFWTDQDILLYIKQNNVKICSIYGDIIEDISGTEQVEGQLTISDLDGFEGDYTYDAKKPKLKTSGCRRTGCMFCGYGCTMERDGEGRFELMKNTHPQQYEYIMKPKNRGGLGYKSVIDWLNQNGNLNIRY